MRVRPWWRRERAGDAGEIAADMFVLYDMDSEEPAVRFGFVVIDGAGSHRYLAPSYGRDQVADLVDSLQEWLDTDET